MVESPRLAATHEREGWERRTLGRLVGGVLCLGVLCGCAGKAPRTYARPEARRLEARLDEARAAVFRVLADRGYGVRREERTDGVIETDWRTVNPDYSASIFITRSEDRYSDCGKPGVGRRYRGKQARLTVRLVAVSGTQTEISVRAAFRTEKRAFFGSTAPMECQSRGRLEEEIFVETQVRALADRFQRRRQERE